MHQARGHRVVVLAQGIVVLAREPDILVAGHDVRAAQRLARGEVKGRPALSSWASVLDYCRAAMAFAEREEFRILFLDKRNRLIADPYTAWSALFVSFGLGALVGFLVIEPTTARAATVSSRAVRRSTLALSAAPTTVR